MLSIDQLKDQATNAVQEALKAEAVVHEYPHMISTAETKAFVALDRIETLALRAQELEDRPRTAEAKLLDAIDAEGPLALEAELEGRV